MQDIVFNDEFEEEPGLCSICGADTALTGWNEEKELTRFECSECGAVFICDNDYNETLVKGEKRNWADFLSTNLRFPFTAIVTEFQGENIFAKERGPIKQNDKVFVYKVIEDDDHYGILVEVRVKSKSYTFPLCDLAVANKSDVNFKIVENYGVWFANCR